MRPRRGANGTQDIGARQGRPIAGRREVTGMRSRRAASMGAARDGERV
jgi:hypothetical protein